MSPVKIGYLKEYVAAKNLFSMVAKKNKKNSFAQKRSEEKKAAKKYLAVFTTKFLLAIIFTIVPLSMLPEDWYAPLNKITAYLSGEILKLITPDTVVRGTHISAGRFTVNVISECSAIHLIALMASFVYAFPSKTVEKLYGIFIGSLFLFALNIMRIAFITITGKHFPGIFDVAHVYLGQLVMIVITICFSLYWCRRVFKSVRQESTVDFVFRFLFFSTILFVFWLPLNKAFMTIVDYCIQWFFALFSNPIHIPQMQSLYYQTFSLISLTGLLLAFKRVKLSTRLRWITLGISILLVFQILFRTGNVFITAYHVEWMTIFSRVVYNLCVFVVPVFFALRLLMHFQLLETKSPTGKNLTFNTFTVSEKSRNTKSKKKDGTRNRNRGSIKIKAV